jgi:hypothetical protein
VAEIPTTPEPAVTPVPVDVGPQTPVVNAPTDSPSLPSENPARPNETPTPPPVTVSDGAVVIAEATIVSGDASTSEPSEESDAVLAAALADDAEAPLAQSISDEAADRRLTPLMKVMWSFALDQPVQRARMLGTQVGEATLAASTVSVDPILKVVQELTLVTPDASGASSAAAVDSGIVANTQAARASLAAALVDAPNSSRNLMLALAAGSAVAAVHWYRWRQRKLQVAAMKLAALMQFDPLAVWVDDAEDEREFV